MKLRKITAAAMSALLAMLGYSCSKDDPWKDMVDAYGSPTADFQFKGTVTNEDGEPIPGIKIEIGPGLMSNENGEGFYVAKAQVTYTDKNGAFTVDKALNTGWGVIRYTDVDGDANGGEFETETEGTGDYPRVQIEEPKKDDTWYLGVYEVTVEKKLKLKE